MADTPIIGPSAPRPNRARTTPIIGPARPQASLRPTSQTLGTPAKISISPTPKLRPPKLKGQTSSDDGFSIGDILDSAKSAAGYVGGVIKGLPLIGGKLGQTVGGLGEFVLDTALDVPTLFGAPEFYRSRFERDWDKAKELGLSGWDQWAYASQRQYPIFAPIVESGKATGGTALELGSLGALDFGEPGFDYYNALKRGELGAKLLEDIGNVVMVGRMAGAGSLSSSAGARLAAAGKPKTGAAVAAVGRLADEPIGAAARATAGLAGRGARATGLTATADALGRISTAVAGEQPTIRAAYGAGRRGLPMPEPTGTGVGPLRQALREVVDIKTTRGLAEFDKLQDKINNKQDERDALPVNDPGRIKLDEEITGLRFQQKGALEKTRLPKEIRETIFELQQRGEEMRTVLQTEIARIARDGVVMETPEKLREDAQNLRKAAQTAEDPATAQNQLDMAELKERQATVKENEPGVLDKPAPGWVSPAVVLFLTNRANLILTELKAGRSFQDIADLLTPVEVTPDLALKGYRFTAADVEAVVRYATNQMSPAERLMVDMVSLLYQSWYKLFNEARLRGVGGTEKLPYTYGQRTAEPKFLLTQLESLKPKETSAILKILDTAVAAMLVKAFPDLAKELKVSTTKNAGIWAKLAKRGYDDPLFDLANFVLAQLNDNLVARYPDIFRNEMIYPAPRRPAIIAANRILQDVRGEAMVGLLEDLDGIIEYAGDLIGKSTLESLRTKIAELPNSSARFSKSKWKQLRTQVIGLRDRLNDPELRARLEKRIQEAEQVVGRRAMRLIEIEERIGAMEATLRTIAADPERFFGEGVARSAADIADEDLVTASPEAQRNVLSAKSQLDQIDRDIKWATDRLAGRLIESERAALQSQLTELQASRAEALAQLEQVVANSVSPRLDPADAVVYARIIQLRQFIEAGNKEIEKKRAELEQLRNEGVPDEDPRFFASQEDDLASLQQRVAGNQEELAALYEQVRQKLPPTETAPARLPNESVRRAGQEEQISDLLQQASRLETLLDSDLAVAQLDEINNEIRRVYLEEPEQMQVTERARRAAIRGRLKGVARLEEANLPGGEKAPAQVSQLKTPQKAAQQQLATAVRQEALAQEKLREIREKHAKLDEAPGMVEDALLAADQPIERQLGQPFNPAAQLEGETAIYLPGGTTRLARGGRNLPTELRTEGMPGQRLASYERLRETDLMPLSLTEVGQRMSEVLSAMNRNETVQQIVTTPRFATNAATLLGLETVEGLRAEAARRVTEQSRIKQGDLGLVRDPEKLKAAINAEFGQLLTKEIERRGYEPISPVQINPDGTSAPLGDLLQQVLPSQVNDLTYLMRKGVAQQITQQFVVKDAANIPPAVSRLFDRIGRLTSGWKSVILPFSLRWQVGDAVSNVLMAWVRGDIPPSELYKSMQDVVDRLRAQEGSFLSSIEGSIADPIMNTLIGAGLQARGLRLGDVAALRSGVPTAEIGTFGLQGPFKGFREKMFRLNEFHNTVARLSVGMRKLSDILDEQGRTIDEVTPSTYLSDTVIRDAINQAVKETNEALGAFSQLSPFEKNVVRQAWPFWSWLKFINKAAVQMAVDNPERVLLMANLGAMALEDEDQGFFDFLQGTVPVQGYLFDLQFLNPYQDAILFKPNILKAVQDQIGSLSPVITTPLQTAQIVFYYGTGAQDIPLGDLTRPGYLEGRPSATSRTFGDMLGEIGYLGLTRFGGPFRNVLRAIPFQEIPVIAPEGRLIGTDVAIGNRQTYPQGSARTQGAYAKPRLGPVAAPISAILSTFGMPAPRAQISRIEPQARLQKQREDAARARRERERFISRGR